MSTIVHNPDCDAVDPNIEGIKKPCNCGGIQLLPCPFCGSEAYVTDRTFENPDTEEYSPWFEVSCTQCEAVRQQGNPVSCPVEAWNTRASDQRADRLADALREILGCFNAAITEGLYEAISESTDERLKDLIQRRLMFSMNHANAALASPSGGEKSGPSVDPGDGWRLVREDEEIQDRDEFLIKDNWKETNQGGSGLCPLDIEMESENKPMVYRRRITSAMEGRA